MGRSAINILHFEYLTTDIKFIQFLEDKLKLRFLTLSLFEAQIKNDINGL